MIAVSLSQSQIAVVTALCIALALPVPSTLPRWDGSHLDAFKATKQLLEVTKEGKF